MPLKRLQNYLDFLESQALSDNYITANRQYLSGFVGSLATLGNTISPRSAKKYLCRSNHLRTNSRIRYAGYLKGFLNHFGMGFDLKIKRPRILPELVSAEDIARLKDAIRGHRTHKASTVRDLLLIDTAIKTGMRRAELANLKVENIDFVRSRVTVVAGKGQKDRVIPISESLREDLARLCEGRGDSDSVFGLNYRSLGMKSKEWADKAGVPIHTHSLGTILLRCLLRRGGTSGSYRSYLDIPA